jgi:hypothetical protein
LDSFLSARANPAEHNAQEDYESNETTYSRADNDASALFLVATVRRICGLQFSNRLSWREFGDPRKIHREVSIIPLLWFHHGRSPGGPVTGSVKLKVPNALSWMLTLPLFGQ